MKVWLVLLTCGMIYAAYYVAAIPVPDKMSDRWKLRAYIVIVQFMNFVVETGDRWGAWNKWNVYQNMVPSSESSETVLRDGLQVTDTLFNGVKVRVYVPEGEKTRSGIVFYHGGGWSLGSAGMYDEMTTKIAASVDTVLVSVDYRLAPNHPYPTPFKDCGDATQYFIENANKYQVDPARIALMGDSAGGNLAAAISLKFRDTFPIKLQVLLYPTLQGLDSLTPSQQDGGDPILTREWMGEFFLNYALGTEWNHTDLQDFLTNNHTSPEVKKQFFSTYLSHSHIPVDMLPDGYQKNKDDFGNIQLWKRLETVMLDPYFAPLLAKDVSKLPEAYIVTCHKDVLRDDGFLYAKRLKDANVKVTHYHIPHGVHGWLSIGFIKSVQESFTIVINFLNNNL